MIDADPCKDDLPPYCDIRAALTRQVTNESRHKYWRAWRDPGYTDAEFDLIDMRRFVEEPLAEGIPSDKRRKVASRARRGH